MSVFNPDDAPTAPVKHPESSMRKEPAFFRNLLIVIGTIVFLIIVTVLLANALG